MDTARYAHNMGLSTLLADEYILIDISLFNFSPGATNKSQQKEYNFDFSFSIGFCSG